MKLLCGSQNPRGPTHKSWWRGEGPTEVHILYKKNHNFRICLPKKSLFFLAYPQNPLVLFFATPPPKIHRPKKSLLAKISDRRISLGPHPPVIKICEWGPWPLGSELSKFEHNLKGVKGFSKSRRQCFKQARSCQASSCTRYFARFWMYTHACVYCHRFYRSSACIAKNFWAKEI